MEGDLVVVVELVGSLSWSGPTKCILPQSAVRYPCRRSPSAIVAALVGKSLALS
jgi:hypothetical protein